LLFTIFDPRTIHPGYSIPSDPSLVLLSCSSAFLSVRSPVIGVVVDDIHPRRLDVFRRPRCGFTSLFGFNCGKVFFWQMCDFPFFLPACWLVFPLGLLPSVFCYGLTGVENSRLWRPCFFKRLAFCLWLPNKGPGTVARVPCCTSASLTFLRRQAACRFLFELILDLVVSLTTVPFYFPQVPQPSQNASPLLPFFHLCFVIISV